MKEKIKILQIIHLALSSGVIIAYVFMNKINNVTDILNISNFSNEVYFYASIPVTAYITSNLAFKFVLKNTDKNASEDFNVNIYQSASIVRWAILESAAFIILFLKPEVLLFGIIILIYLIILRPTEAQFKNDINRL